VSGRELSALIPVLVLGGCSGNHSVFNPAGPAARALATLTWQLLFACGIVYLVVIAVLLIAVARGRDRGYDNQAPIATPHAGTQRRANGVVAASLILTFVLLSVFVGISYATDRRLLTFEQNADLTVKITAHQW
jgi:heme/copper-type cytochrome/quinol oxidase subunit 2